MIQITLSEKEYKLLMSILVDCEDERSNMSCNDPYKGEEKIFTKKERIEMQKSLSEDLDDLDGFLFNCDYVQFIINKIKKTKVKV